MPESSERTIEDRLAALAVRLDEAAPPLTAGDARARRVMQPRPPRRHPLLVAGASALAVAAAVAGFAVLVQGDDPARVSTADHPSPTTNTTAPPIPAAGTLPFSLQGSGESPSLLVWNNSELALIDYTGREFARAPQGDWYTNNPDRGVDLVPGGDGVMPIEAVAIDDPIPGCDAVHGRGGILAAACGGVEEGASEIRVAAAGDTTTRRLTGARRGVGHWRYALPSPDGKWVLAQWSGECETPAAFLIDVASGRVDDVAPAGVDSYGIGWAPDGRAVVGVDAGPCGAETTETGTFLIDANRKVRTRIHPFASGAMVQWAHMSAYNRLERKVDRALEESGLEGCCGEPSHGGETNAAGMVFEGTEIEVHAVPQSLAGGLEPARPEEVRFRCGSDVYTFGEFNSSRAGRALVQRAADRLASRLYCSPVT